MPKWEKTGKHMSLRTIWKAVDDKECEEANNLYAEFHRKVVKSYSWDMDINYDETPCSARSYCYDFLQAHPKLYPWMERKGFLRQVKPKFEPFELRIETEDEAKALYHRLNPSWVKIKPLTDQKCVEFPTNPETYQVWNVLYESLLARGLAKKIT